MEECMAVGYDGKRLHRLGYGLPRQLRKPALFHRRRLFTPCAQRGIGAEALRDGRDRRPVHHRLKVLHDAAQFPIVRISGPRDDTNAVRGLQHKTGWVVVHNDDAVQRTVQIREVLDESRCSEWWAVDLRAVRSGKQVVHVPLLRIQHRYDFCGVPKLRGSENDDFKVRSREFQKFGDKWPAANNSACRGIVRNNVAKARVVVADVDGGAVDERLIEVEHKHR